MRAGTPDTAHASLADRLRLAQSISATGLFDWDTCTGRIVWSEDLLRIYGVDAAGFPGTYEAWRRFVPPEDLAAVEARIKAALDRQAPSLALDFRIRRRDGALRRIECFVAFSHAADGTPLHGIGVTRGTTDTARVLRALGESEAHTRASFDQAAVGIVEADRAGRWLRVNTRLAAMLGYDTPEALQGRSWLELTHPDDGAAGARQLAALQQGRISRATADKRFLARDGTAIWADATVSVVLDPGTGTPAFLTSVIVDATDRKRADAARAMPAARLRLGGMQGKMPEAQRAARGEAIGLGQAGVTIRNAVPEALPEVLADAVQIRQVLCNLVRNAAQALQEVPAGWQRRSVTVTGTADRFELWRDRPGREAWRATAAREVAHDRKRAGDAVTNHENREAGARQPARESGHGDDQHRRPSFQSRDGATSGARRPGLRGADHGCPVVRPNSGHQACIQRQQYNRSERGQQDAREAKGEVR